MYTFISIIHSHKFRVNCTDPLELISSVLSCLILLYYLPISKKNNNNKIKN